MAMPFAPRLGPARRLFLHPKSFRHFSSLSRRSTTQSSLGGAPTSKPISSRKQITVTSDDGRYRWAELSTGEKVARSTQQSFFFILVIGGATATVKWSLSFWIHSADIVNRSLFSTLYTRNLLHQTAKLGNSIMPLTA